jgi:lipid-A-disaccharide synthase-like uncharacterized protein
MLMEREELIQLLVIDLESRSSMPASYWKVRLNKMTDEELLVVLEMVEKAMVEKLKKEDLVPFLKILSKYHQDIANSEDGDDFIGLN